MAVLDRPARKSDKVLEAELATYDRHRDELLGTAEGKYVLIKGDAVGGLFESKMDAIARGYETYGNVPFLVKQIVPVEVPESFFSNNLTV